MNHVFYLIPLLLVISIPTAFAQTATSATSATGTSETESIAPELDPFVFTNQPYTKPNNLTDEGVGFYEIRNPDGTFTLTSHYPYFETESGELLPYRLNEDSSMIQVEVNGGKIVFDKNNGSMTLFNDEGIIVDSDSYVVRSALSGSDVWNNLDVNNSPLTFEVIEQGETLIIEISREDETGLFKMQHIVFGGKLKTTAFFTNYSLENTKIAFTETLNLPDNIITLNDQVIDLNQFVGMSFDRETLEQNEDLVIQVKERFFNTGIGFDNLWQVNIHENNTVSLDYANTEHVMSIGETIGLDPTWNITGTINGNNVDFNISTLNNASVNSGDIDGTALTSTQITSLQNALNSGTTTWSQPYTAGAIWDTSNLTYSVASGYNTSSNPIRINPTSSSGGYMMTLNTGNNGSIELSADQNRNGGSAAATYIKDMSTSEQFQINYPRSQDTHTSGINSNWYTQYQPQCNWLDPHKIVISGTTVTAYCGNTVAKSGGSANSSNFTALVGTWGSNNGYNYWDITVTGDFAASAPTLNVNYTLLPTPPTDVSATQNTTTDYNTVDLSWNMGTGGSNPTSYTVYRDSSSIGTVTNTTTTTTSGGVAWQNAAGGISINGQTISKSGNSWNNGVQGTTSWDASQSAELVFNVLSTNQHSFVGFGKDPFVADSSDIQYVLYPASNGTLCFYENNVQLSSLCNSVSYSTIDDLKVKMNNGVVTYWKNNTLLHTSTLPATGTYYAQASLYSSGVVVDATLSTSTSVLDTTFTDTNAPDSSNLSYTVTGTNTVGTSAQSSAGLIETFYTPNQVVNVTNQGANTPLVLDWDIPTVPSVTKTITYPDSLGSSADGTNVGTTTTGVSGIIGDAWNLADTGDVDFNIPMTSDHTIGMWLEFPIPSSTWTDYTFITSTTNGHYLYADPSKVVGYYSSGGNFASSGYDLDNVSSGWHYLVLTSDHTNTETKIYIDGTQVGNTINSVKSNGVAMDSISNINQGIGKIDEVVIYNKALTASEISALYNSGNGDSTPDTSGLLAHYDFEQTGTILPNQASTTSQHIQSNTNGGAYGHLSGYGLDYSIGQQIQSGHPLIGETIESVKILVQMNNNASGGNVVGKIWDSSGNTKATWSTIPTSSLPTCSNTSCSYTLGSDGTIFTGTAVTIATGDIIGIDWTGTPTDTRLWSGNNVESNGKLVVKNSATGGFSDIDSGLYDVVYTAVYPDPIQITTPSPSLSGYQIERDDGSGFNVIEANHNTNQYSDSTASGSVVYKISGLNAVGTGTASANHNALAGTPPDPPTNLTSSIQDVNTNPLNVVLNWTSPSNVGTGTLSGFEVYRNGSLITTTGLVTTYTDTVTDGTHSYYAKAVSNHGSSVASNTTNITTPTIPNAINDLSGSVISDTQINLSWTAPSDGGSNIDLYKIFKDGTQIDTTTNLNYSATGLTANTAYTFLVVANNSVGDSANSNSVNLTTYQSVGGSIAVTTSTQGATTEFTFTPNNISGTPTPNFNTFTLMEGVNEIASGISSPYYLAHSDASSKTYSITSTDNSHWDSPTITGTITAQSDYAPNWNTQNVSYNYTRNSGVMDLTVNKDSQNTWDAVCSYKTTTEVIDGDPGISSTHNGIWYISESQSINDADTVYVSCVDGDDQLFSFTSFGPNRLAGGIAQLDNVFGDMTGTPVALIFVLLVAGLFTGRSAPTGILLVLALVGVLGFIGMLTIDEAVWGFLLLAGVLGIFIGKRFL